MLNFDDSLVRTAITKSIADILYESYFQYSQEYVNKNSLVLVGEYQKYADLSSVIWERLNDLEQDLKVAKKYYDKKENAHE